MKKTKNIRSKQYNDINQLASRIYTISNLKYDISSFLRNQLIKFDPVLASLENISILKTYI
jgi:hypothetical protein